MNGFETKRLEHYEKEHPVEIVEADMVRCIVWIPDQRLRLECERDPVWTVNCGRYSRSRDYYDPLAPFDLHETVKDFNENRGMLRTRVHRAALAAMDKARDEYRQKRALDDAKKRLKKKRR